MFRQEVPFLHQDVGAWASQDCSVSLFSDCGRAPCTLPLVTALRCRTLKLCLLLHLSLMLHPQMLTFLGEMDSFI